MGALIPYCKVCLVNRQSNTRAPLKPIEATRVFERIQIDLIDFRHEPDGRFLAVDLAMFPKKIRMLVSAFN